MLEKIDRQLLSRSFIRFIEHAWDQLEGEKYVHGKHLEVVARHLEAAAVGKIDRLLINLPPSCSKSTVLMVMFPAWVWTFNRKASFLCQTYSHDLTLRDATAGRRLVESEWYRKRWPEVRFHSDDNAKQYYRVTGGGWRLSTTVGGRATGEHPSHMGQFDAAAKAIILGNEEIGKLKKRALVSGMQQSVEICVSPGCDRPAAGGSDYCCGVCETTSQFQDPAMIVDHTQECNHRSHKFFNKR